MYDSSDKIINVFKRALLNIAMLIKDGKINNALNLSSFNVLMDFTKAFDKAFTI